MRRGRSFKSFCVGWCAGFALAVPLAAQAQAVTVPVASAAATAPLTTYEVSSVRVNTSGSNNMSWNSHPGGTTMENIAVVWVIKSAYELNASGDDRLVGLPAWAGTQRFDINAKVAPEDVPAFKKMDEHQRAVMLRGLLKDRFGLVAHFETRQGTFYALVLAKGGAKLAAAETPVAAANDGAAPKPKAGRTPGPGGIMINNGHMQANGITLDRLVPTLAGETERSVVDETGLKGVYTFNLNWTPADEAGTAEGDAAPGIFGALEEQLGLRLETRKGPVQVLVVDHLEEPAAN